MGNRDSIDWCNDQIDSARDTLKSIDAGERRYINGEEITGSVAAKATAIIATMTALITAYMLLGTN